jgi:hypothetical protein
MYTSSEGIKMAAAKPLDLGLGALIILILYVIFSLPNSNLAKIMTTDEKGFFGRLEKSNFRIPVAIFLLVIAFGDFVYANSELIKTGHMTRFEYIFGLILSLMAFELLRKKN